MDNVMTNKELKACLVDILLAVTKYCDKHNLKYSLSSGTLLGAVRHKGFIPWDDDIDIYMPRDDYEMLHKLVHEEPIGPNLIIESLYEGNSAFPFGKVIDTNTEIVNSHSDLMKSLWIDIFPVDGVTQEMVDNIKQINYYLFLLLRLLSKSAINIKKVNSVKDKLLVIIAKLSGSAVHYGKKIEKYSKRHKITDCPYAANLSWGGTNYYLDSKLLFEDRVKLTFEGHEFYVTQLYEEFLTKQYGDYMKLPPENERLSHNIIARRIVQK